MTTDTPIRTAIVIGASGGIGNALFDAWLDNDAIDHVIGISRQDSDKHSDRSRWIRTDYSTEAIEQVCDQLADKHFEIHRVCICNGILHDGDIWPEKKIEELDMLKLQELYRINCLIPMTWIQHLLPVIKGKHDCTVSVISARIGSIQDNRSGGWYGYRASKAALNMMLKTAAIEFARRAKNVKLMAIHPGTTDTNLSRPFQQNIKYEINTPQHVANSMVGLMEAAEIDGTASYLDWEGVPIEW